MKKAIFTLMVTLISFNAIAQPFQPVLVKDIITGVNSTYFANVPSNYVELNGKLYFSKGGSPYGANELWVSDGTNVGTYFICDLTNYSNQQCLITKSGNFIYFFREPSQSTDNFLWKTDGTVAGSQLVKKVYPQVINSQKSTIVDINGTVYFGGHDQLLGENELWKSNGTDAGTVMVKKINPNNGSSPTSLLNVNGVLTFTGVKYSGSTAALKYFKSDGTSSGTADFFDLTTIGSRYQNFNSNGTLFFSRPVNNFDYLWKTNPTYTSVSVADSFPSYAFDGKLTYMNGYSYFIASDGVNGKELWKTNGTPSGTMMLKDINPGAADGASGHIWNMVQSGSYIYFCANNGTDGDELWRTDGTAAGTVMVKDIFSGSLSSTPRPIRDVNGTLYFYVTNQLLDFELWRTDGTTPGTIKVMENPAGGSAGFIPGPFTFIGNTVYFPATTGPYGRELWKLDLSGTSGISENKVESSVKMYPNPVANILTIEVNGPLIGQHYSLTDIAGKVMLNGQLSGEKTFIDLSQIQTGLYFVKVDGLAGQTFKVIK